MNDILHTPGSNAGSIIDHAYIAKLADVDETALNALSVAAATATGEKSLSLSSALPLVANAKFGKVYFTKGVAAGLVYNRAGERDGGIRNVTVNFNKPKLEVAGDEVLDGLLNGPVVIIVKDGQGKLRLCGVNRREDDTLGLDYPMYLENDEAGTGDTPEAKAGHTLTFSGHSTHAPLFYTGAIDLDAGT